MHVAETRTYACSYMEMGEIVGASLAWMPVVGNDLQSIPVFEGMSVSCGLYFPGAALRLGLHNAIDERGHKAQVSFARELHGFAAVGNERMLLAGTVTITSHQSPQVCIRVDTRQRPLEGLAKVVEGLVRVFARQRLANGLANVGKEHSQVHNPR